MEKNGLTLESLKLPGDLQKLDYDELDIVASLTRQRIIETVSRNGGHLAPSLGVVELTIALLRTYNLDEDKIVWDVGHQSYAYKILTDRLSSFHTLRRFGGISGFCKPSESPYDVCVSGHTSTSISAASGLSVGKAIQGGNGQVACVIGDGAMSGGMAFEALNNLGSLNKNLVVILNDNEMSISRNTGGFAAYLSQTLTGEFATKVKRDIENIFEDAPLGDKLLAFAKKVESSIIGFLTPGSIFEQLGIKYIGPINGHKIKDIEKAIKNAKLQSTPVLIHVLTVKGKGYEKAEECPDIFHGISAFDVKSGKSTEAKPDNPSWTKIFSEKIISFAESDGKVVAVTAAMKDGTGLKNFAEKYPERFFDVGIAEQHAVTFCAGLATSGMKPYFAVYSTFLQRAYDQIIHDVAIPSLPVTICIDRAGLVGADGPTHHGMFDMAYLRAVPNFTVMLPKDPFEFNEMMDIAKNLQTPAAIRYPRGEAKSWELPKTPVEIGVPEIIAKGRDIAIVSCGHIFGEAYALYKKLTDAGASVSLINLRFLKPLNTERLLSELTGKALVITVEEGVLNGGAGEMIQSVMIDGGVCQKVMRFGLPDKFIEHGSVAELRKTVGLDAQSMFHKAETYLKQSVKSPLKIL